MRYAAGALYAAVTLFYTPAYARLDLQLPVDCTIGTNCFIQNYMDHNPAKDAVQDYTCGSLTYDGHNGTDFRVPTYANLAGGVKILATAAGEVAHVQALPEIKKEDAPLVQLMKLRGMHNKCGSTIRIDHGTGWQSIYCHLDPDGVTVAKGDRVKAGQVIGRMGTSGKTQFPHVHYELRHYNNPIDPFVGYAGAYDCSPEKRYSQWHEAVAGQLFYVQTGIIDAGFSHNAPTAQLARNGTAYAATLDNAAPAIHFGVELYGLRTYDVLTVRIFAPDGALLAEKRTTYDNPYAVSFETLSAEGKTAWPQGIYSAQVTLDRFEHVLKKTVINRRWQIKIDE